MISLVTTKLEFPPWMVLSQHLGMECDIDVYWEDGLGKSSSYPVPLLKEAPHGSLLLDPAHSIPATFVFLPHEY